MQALSVLSLRLNWRDRQVWGNIVRSRQQDDAEVTKGRRRHTTRGVMRGGGSKEIYFSIIVNTEIIQGLVADILPFCQR